MTDRPAPSAPEEPAGGPQSAEQPAPGPRVEPAPADASGGRTATPAERAALTELIRLTEDMGLYEDRQPTSPDAARYARWLAVIRADRGLDPAIAHAITAAAIREADDEHTGTQLACAEQAARAEAHLEGVSAEADGWQRRYEHAAAAVLAARALAERWRHTPDRKRAAAELLEELNQAGQPAPTPLPQEEPMTDHTSPEPADTDARPDARQPAYDAVYAHIHALGDHMPPDPVHRNAMIWQAVHAALDATPVGRCVSSHCAEGDHVLIVDEPQPEPTASCCCGEPSIPRSVHRTDGPCYVTETAPAGGSDQRRQQYAEVVSPALADGRFPIIEWVSPSLQRIVGWIDGQQVIDRLIAVADAEKAQLRQQLADAEERAEEAGENAELHARNTETVARERESYRQAWKTEQRQRAEAEQRVERAAKRTEGYRRRVELADAVTAETKRLMQRRTTTLRQRAERAEAALDRVRALADRWALPGHISMPQAAADIRDALDGPAEPGTNRRDKDAEIRAALDRVRAERDQLVTLVRDFLDPDPCRYDHHGYCQAHAAGFGGEPHSCPHARAREVLAALDTGRSQP